MISDNFDERYDKTSSSTVTYTINIHNISNASGKCPEYDYIVELGDASPLRITMGFSSHEAVIHIGDLTKPYPTELVELLVLYPLRKMLLDTGYVFFHSAWLCGFAHNVFLIGRTAQGKSSLSITLAESGDYYYHCDDQLFVSLNEQRDLFACLPIKLGLRKNAKEKWPYLLRDGEPSLMRGKTRILPPQRWRDLSPPPTNDKNLLLFLNYEEGTQGAKLEDIDFDEALQQLVGDARIRYEQPNVNILTDEVFFTLYSFLKKNTYKKLSYDHKSLDDIAPLLTKHLSGSTNG